MSAPSQKRKFMKTLCFFLFVITLVFLIPEAEGVEWVSMGEDMSGNEWFYDTENLRTLQRGIIKTWWKIKYSDEGRNLFIQQLNGLGWETQKTQLYETLSYSLNLIEMNCTTRETRLVLISNYSVNHVLDSVNTKQLPLEEWDPVADKSIGDAMYKVVCSPKEKK
jgi:hypothetical protein